MLANYDQLVLAAAQGDAEAYGQLVNETSPLVSSIALSIVRDLEASRDVSQDVFLAVWRDLKTLRNPASFLPWLRQLTRNRSNEFLRTLVRRRQQGGTQIPDDLLPVLADPRANASEQIVWREELRILEEALEMLPPETREIVTLFYREGQSVAQVAALLDMSEDAVKKRLSRARQYLRESVQQQIGETLSRTRPDSNFTAVVIAALPSAPAPVATAVAGGMFKIIAPLSGALFGAVFGSLGVLFGSRKLLAIARDEQERRSLQHHKLVSIAAVTFFAAALPVAYIFTHMRWIAVPWFLCFLATLAVLQNLWLPRIVSRRLQAEMREDPQQATKRHTTERRNAMLGWVLGISLGSLGLAVGLWFTR